MGITMKDIAEHAGVSTATVSKIINGQDRYISNATRERVMQLVEKYNYKPNALAKGLKVKKTNTIGFILPDISNPFFPEIARGIEDVAKKMGFAVVFCDTDNDPLRERECVSFLKAKMVDGLIFTKALQKGQIEEYLNGKIPMVVVDRYVDTENTAIGRVFINARSAIADSTSFLIERGCRRIAFISARSGRLPDRIDGYKDALQHHGYPMEESLIYCGDYDVETGYIGTKELLSKDQAVDGIVCGNDLIAVGVINAAHELGLPVPERLKVIGMDNIYFSRFLSPALTTISQPAYEMGKVAAKMLIDHILDDTPLFFKELKYELIVRDSA